MYVNLKESTYISDKYWVDVLNFTIVKLFVSKCVANRMHSTSTGTGGVPFISF